MASSQRKSPSTKPRSTRRNGKAPPKRSLKVKVIVHEAEEGGYWAEVPALPGCVTEGDTRAELLANLREAVEGCLLTTPGSFEAEPGGREEEIEL
jgi:predicted RNase H-like HicB family nuclease